MKIQFWMIDLHATLEELFNGTDFPFTWDLEILPNVGDEVTISFPEIPPLPEMDLTFVVKNRDWRIADNAVELHIEAADEVILGRLTEWDNAKLN